MNSISKNIFTNKNLINNLKNLFLNNSLPNSLIFYGQKGIGKNTLAFYLIKEIYGNLSIDNQSKHHINLIYNHTHPNIRYITKEYDPKKNKFKNSILIDQIRKLDNFFYQTSSDAMPKFVIIDSADDLNLNAANSLLKVLEESNKNTFFILITHQISNIIPTIRSRCIKYNISKPNSEEFKNIITFNNEFNNNQDLDFLYDLTNGSPGISVNIISDNLKELYYSIIQVFEQKKPISPQIKELVNQVSEYSNDQYKIFLILLKFILINIAKINLQLNLKKQFSTDINNHLKKAASKINNNTTFSILDFLNKNENDLFIYNLDKRIFSLNIFSSLKLINE